MIANRNAEITLCRADLRSGASPQAQALACTMLAQRQAAQQPSPTATAMPHCT
jgi:hypothetical protein